MLTTLEGNLRVCTTAMLASVAPRFYTLHKLDSVKIPIRPHVGLISMLSSEMKSKKQQFLKTERAHSLLKDSGFVLIETADTPMVSLVKNVEMQTVIIEFVAKDHIAESLSDVLEEKEELMSNVQKYLVEFNIAVKDEHGKGLLFQCSCQDSQLNINRIGYCKNFLMKNNNLQVHTDNIIQGKEYSGPLFIGLEESVKLKFMHYLENLGITDKIFRYIHEAAISKEQRLYIKWLEDVKTFVSDSQ